MIDRIKEVSGASVSRETFDKITAYVELLRREAKEQNLISASSLDQIWERHIVDSAQFLRYSQEGSWVDIGSGAGLPGVVIAILTADPVTLVEPRRLRAEFLSKVGISLELRNVTVVPAKASVATGLYDNITARAVATLTKTFELSCHLARKSTVWILPKGESAQLELAKARLSWQGRFRLEPSLTNMSSRIIVATGVEMRLAG